MPTWPKPIYFHLKVPADCAKAGKRRLAEVIAGRFTGEVVVNANCLVEFLDQLVVGETSVDQMTANGLEVEQSNRTRCVLKKAHSTAGIAHK